MFGISSALIGIVVVKNYKTLTLIIRDTNKWAAVSAGPHPATSGVFVVVFVHVAYKDQVLYTPKNYEP